MKTFQLRADMGGRSNDDAFLTITVFCYFMFVIIICTLVYLLCYQEEKRRCREREIAVSAHVEQMYSHGSGSVIQNPMYVGVRERSQSPAAYGL